MLGDVAVGGVAVNWCCSRQSGSHLSYCWSVAVGAPAVGGVAVGKVAVGGELVGEVAFGGVVVEPGAVGDPFVLEPFCVGAQC